MIKLQGARDARAAVGFDFHTVKIYDININNNCENVRITVVYITRFIAI